MIRVVLADDQPLLRAGLRLLLDAEDDLEVVGEADDGRAAVALVRRAASRRRGDGRPHARGRRPRGDPGDRRRSRLEAVRVVVLTTFDLDEYVFEAIRSGATGFLLKDAEPTDLVRAVRCASEGEALVSPSVTRRLIAEFAARPEHRPVDTDALDELTDREREVVALVAGGLSNDEIAETLFISRATARTHVSRAMTKLDARDRAQLVVAAYESGLVSPRPG